MAPTEAALNVRPALAAEQAVVARVHLAARAAASMPASRWTAAELSAQFADAWAADEFWVATAGPPGDEEVVGYVRFVRPDGDRVGWLDDLYVLPDSAGLGVGTLLLDVVKAMLPEGFGLWAFERNDAARAFYRSRGLREVEFVPADESPEGESEVRITWP